MQLQQDTRPKMRKNCISDGPSLARTTLEGDKFQGYEHTLPVLLKIWKAAGARPGQS